MVTPAKQPRAGIGSNQYQSRGAPRQDRRRSAAGVAAAVSTDPEPEPLRQTQLWVSTPSGKEHMVIVMSDGSVHVGPCRGCESCRKVTDAYEQIRSLGVAPLVAGVCAKSKVADPETRDQVCRDWHSECGCGGSPPSFAEIAEWAAVGVRGHLHANACLDTGYDVPRLFSSHLSHPQNWYISEFTTDEALAWDAAGFHYPWTLREFRQHRMDPAAALRWRTAVDGEIPDDAQSNWLQPFPNADEAVAWHRALRTSSVTTDQYGMDARMCRRLHDDGAKPEDMGRWTTFSRQLGTIADWVTASAGDPDLAQRMSKRFKGSATAAAQATRVTGNPVTALAWAELNVTDKDTLEMLTKQNVTPEQVAADRMSGEHEVKVLCNTHRHTIRVTWKNGRPTWSAPNHDRELERIATAFGGEPHGCAVALSDAKGIWNGGASARTPGTALDAIDAGDPYAGWGTP